MKQFCHYLLGRRFQLVTDQAPLQWLPRQKMEGLLCRWALALQECDFGILYRKCLSNGIADDLPWSWCSDAGTAESAITVVSQLSTQLHSSQQQDMIIKQLYKTLSESHDWPRTQAWRKPPLCHYGQIWSQLTLVDGIVCRRYALDPSSDVITIPVLPKALQEQALHHAHNLPTAGHLYAPCPNVGSERG